MADSQVTDMQAPGPEPRRMEKSGSSARVHAGKFEIDPDRELQHFSHPYANAYECISNEGGQSDHVAIVIKERSPVQREAIDRCLSNEVRGMMVLRTSMLVRWPDDSQRYVLIYRQPPGKALVPKGQIAGDAYCEDMLRKSVIQPILQALIGLARLGQFHGNVRPDNIFLSSHDNAEAMLGEFASSLPGINQPVIFETVERAMADPQGRGAGTIGDDLYAFGVTLAMLLHGQNPLQQKSDRQILEEKISHGTFNLMIEGLRLTPAMSELLRALLNDDPAHRWNIDQLNSWMEGNRTTSKQPTLSIKAQRALDFNGKKYFRTRTLAKDLHENVAEAATLIESGLLVKWIERALNNQNMADAVNAAISQANTGGHTPGYEDRLLCFVSMAIDPQAPIRFKNIKAFPNAIGNALACAMLSNQGVQNFGEMIRDRYGWVWLNYRENARYNNTALVHTLDQASRTITRRGMDYGLERCLYELCPDVPCLSDFFSDFYVVNCHALLLGLNEVAPRFKDKRPIDRHIASFVMTRDTHDNAGLMVVLEGSDQMRRSLALLTLYQQLQKRFDNPKLVHLCEWLEKDAEFVIQRYHNIPLKQSLLKYLPKEAKTGELSRMLGLIDSPHQVRKDETDFARAMQYYAMYGRERDSIRLNLDTNKNFGFGSGQYVAFVIAVVTSLVLVTMTLLTNFTRLGG